jgi:hypothetical protein
MPLGFRRAGLPVSQSTEDKDAKTLPTTNNPLVCRTSLALSQPIIVPVDLENPVLRASYTPFPAAYPPGNVFFIFSHDVDSPVRGATVHHDIFEIRIPLLNDGADSLLNVANSVVYRRDQRDARPSRRWCL